MPLFTEIRGQTAAHELIRRAAARGRLPHAYLFHGTAGVGKTSTAFALAQYVNCEQPTESEPCGECNPCKKISRFKHPDLRWLFPMQTSVKGAKRADHIRKSWDERLKPEIFRFHFPGAASIAIGRDSDTRAGSVGELRYQAGMTSIEAKVKVFVISEADRMTDAAANSLLKVLEEPPPENLLVLCSANPGTLLDTIVSRCQAVRFRDLTEDLVASMLVERAGVEEATASLAAALGQGSLTRAAALAEEDIVAARDRIVELLELRPTDPRAHAAVDELAGLRDREVIARMLDFGLVWHADLLHTATGSDVPLANRDREEEVRRAAGGLSVPEIERRVEVLREARAAMQGNVYLPLVLRGMMEGLAGRPVYTT